MKYIFTNFGSGNGPYIRTIDMGIELINILKEKFNEEFSILSPLVYGNRQKRIINEEFGEILEKQPDLILFDEYIGQQFKKILFDGRNYDIIMQELVSSYDNVEKKIQEYLTKQELLSKNIHGKPIKVKGKDIILEVSRNPNVATNIKYSYYTSVGYFEKIILKSIENPNLKLNKNFLKNILPIAKKIESYQQLYFQPEPNCFSYEKDDNYFKDNEIRCPPLFHPPKENKTEIIEGFYVLVSGIPFLKRIYHYTKKISYKIYTNQILEDFKEAQRENPIIISNKNIKFIFARPAWNTIWLANLSKKPLIFLDYEQGDFPEIYFNIISVNKHKLGMKFKEDLRIENIIEQSKSNIPEIVQFYEKIGRKYGTLDGIKFSCKLIAEDFLKKFNSN
ncbi:MAG: hypothetical protein ACFFAN_00545 [Promethearchaeota archaeon]